MPNAIEAGKLTQFTTVLLYELLGKDALGPMLLISVAHNTGPWTSQKRCMITQVHILDGKHTILRMKAGNKYQYQGQKVSIYLDLTVDQQKQHATFSDIRDLLQKTKLKYGVVHPTKTLITFHNETRSFIFFFFYFLSPFLTAFTKKSMLGLIRVASHSIKTMT